MSGSGKLSRSKAAAGKPAVRAVIEAVAPAVDGGRFPIKRALGEEVVVEADCFADGRRVGLSGAVPSQRRRLAQCDYGRAWERSPRAAFTVDRIGAYRYGDRLWTRFLLAPRFRAAGLPGSADRGWSAPR
jgi:starch synthase (maltosyl-transferring)